MVKLVRITAGNNVKMSFCKRRFDLHDGSGLRRSDFGIVSEQLEHARDVRDVSFAKLDGFGIVFEIVVPLGKSEAALVKLGDDVLRVLEVLASQSKTWLRSGNVKTNQFGCELVPCPSKRLRPRTRGSEALCPSPQYLFRPCRSCNNLRSFVPPEFGCSSRNSSRGYPGESSGYAHEAR